MREMRWTYDELQATPIDVRAYCWDCIQMERVERLEEAERLKRERDKEQGLIRVPR